MSIKVLNRKLVIGLVTCLILLLAVGVESCQTEEILQQGRVIFGATAPKTVGSGRTESINVAGAIITLKDVRTGNLVFDHQTIHLNAFGASFVSDPISITTGDYLLTEFLLVDETNAVVYASPAADSPKGGLVSNPLPLAVNVQKDQATQIIPEVLTVTSTSSPAEFGLISFDFTNVNSNSLDIKVPTTQLSPTSVRAFILNTVTHHRQWVTLIDDVNGMAMVSVALQSGTYLVELDYEVPYTGSSSTTTKMLKSEKIITYDENSSTEISFSSPATSPSDYSEWISTNNGGCTYEIFLSTDPCNPDYKIYLCDEVTSGYFSFGKDFFPNGVNGTGSSASTSFFVATNADDANQLGFVLPPDAFDPAILSLSNTGLITGSLIMGNDDLANCSAARNNSSGKINFQTNGIQLYNGAVITTPDKEIQLK